MAREFDFLFASVRRFFQPESLMPSKEGLDPNAVHSLADRHGVSGFLADGDSPEPAEDTRDAARSTLALSAQLVKLAGLFQNEGIEIVPLKGPVLGAALYRDKPLKSSTDLDILVRPGDALRAKRVLESAGYRLETVPHWQSERAYLRNVNDELSFNDPRLWLKLDLHWSLLPGYFPAPFPEAELWAGLRSVSWGGVQLRTLSPEQQVMFLCAHGAKHLWSRLAWICDLARLLQVEPAIDWPEVFDRVRRSHTTRVLLIGLVVAHTVSGVPLPLAAVPLLDADPRARALAAAALTRLRAGRPATAVATAVFCARALERNRQRARLIFGMFVQPTEAEYRALQMPPALYGLYYLFRPLRLATKYARRVSST